MLVNAFAIDFMILTGFFTTWVVGTLRWKPRIWLHSFPDDIQAHAVPKTPEEQRLTRQLGFIFIPAFYGLLVLLTWDIKSALGTDYSYLHAWVYAYALFVGINMWDLVVLDWIGFRMVDPQNPPFPGTEGVAGWRDDMFHFRGFLKGCVIGLAFATKVAAIVSVVA